MSEAVPLLRGVRGVFKKADNAVIKTHPLPLSRGEPAPNTGNVF